MNLNLSTHIVIIFACLYLTQSVVPIESSTYKHPTFITKNCLRHHFYHLVCFFSNDFFQVCGVATYTHKHT